MKISNTVPNFKVKKIKKKLNLKQSSNPEQYSYQNRESKLTYVGVIFYLFHYFKYFSKLKHTAQPPDIRFRVAKIE